MARTGILESAGRRIEKGVEDGHERTPVARPAEASIEQREHLRGRRIEVDGKLEGGVGDRHQEPSGHPMSARVTDHHSEAPIRQQ